MAAIVPRWEWRTFGSTFGAAEEVFARLTPGEPKESDELYLFSEPAGNAKIREDLMDVKVLREVDANGLERWEPVMKAGFPLAAAEVSDVFDALRLPPPRLDRASYTLDQLLTEIVGPGNLLRAVKVHKRRVRYRIDGCMAEITEVVAEGRPIRTIAIESEDAAGVIAAVRSAGLGGYVNTSYPKALAALLDDELARYAVIDVGTNSVKFHLGERGPDGGWRAIADRAEMTRLGGGLQESGEIAAEPLARTVEAVAAMVDEARLSGTRAIAAVGTAGLRIARNAGEVVAAILARTGITVEVISGEEESRLAYMAAVAGVGVGEGSVVVFDTGGGSTQFTFGQDGRVDERFSVDVGAVRYTERSGLDSAVEPEVLREALAVIASDLSRIDERPAPDALVAMGGAVTNIAAVKHGLATYDPDVVQGTVLDLPEIDRQIELYRSRDAEGRRSIVGLQPKRAEVILAGACIVRTVMEKLGRNTLTVSDRGLRHGVLAERFGT